MKITTEQTIQLKQEIDELKLKKVGRQAISLHICTRLWIDFGIRPTSTKIRELTKKGSMTNLIEDVDLFWEKTRKQLKDFYLKKEKNHSNLNDHIENEIHKRYIDTMEQLKTLQNKMLLQAEDSNQKLFDLAQHAEKRFKPLLIELDSLRRKVQQMEKEREDTHQLLKSFYQAKQEVEMLKKEVQQLRTVKR